MAKKQLNINNDEKKQSEIEKNLSYFKEMLEKSNVLKQGETYGKNGDCSYMKKDLLCKEINDYIFGDFWNFYSSSTVNIYDLWESMYYELKNKDKFRTFFFDLGPSLISLLDSKNAIDLEEDVDPLSYGRLQREWIFKYLVDSLDKVNFLIKDTEFQIENADLEIESPNRVGVKKISPEILNKHTNDYRHYFYKNDFYKSNFCKVDRKNFYVLELAESRNKYTHWPNNLFLKNIENVLYIVNLLSNNDTYPKESNMVVSFYKPIVCATLYLYLVVREAIDSLEKKYIERLDDVFGINNK